MVTREDAAVLRLLPWQNKESALLARASHGMSAAARKKLSALMKARWRRGIARLRGLTVGGSGFSLGSDASECNDVIPSRQSEMVTKL